MPLNDIQITRQEDGVVRVRMFNWTNEKPNPMEAVNNLNNLSQRVVKKILTAKGSMTRSINFGCDFYTLVGTYDSSNIEQIRELVPIIIDDVITQIKVEQVDMEIAGNTLNANETLLDIQIVKLLFDEMFGGWQLDIKIITKAGTANLTVL